jgi:hypothetical protein
MCPSKYDPERNHAKLQNVVVGGEVCKMTQYLSYHMTQNFTPKIIILSDFLKNYGHKIKIANQE